MSNRKTLTGTQREFLQWILDTDFQYDIESIDGVDLYWINQIRNTLHSGKYRTGGGRQKTFNALRTTLLHVYKCKDTHGIQVRN